MMRTWKRLGLESSALGLGCWPVSGTWNDPDAARGWIGVTDEESIRAIRAAVEHGVTLFDTADTYGAGHSERLLGEALRGRRERVLIATKFGHTFDEERRATLPEVDGSPAYLRRAVEASLRRLGTDRIDLYQLHIWDHPLERAEEVVGALERLVDEGKIRTYGWSTDRLAGVQAFARGPRCGAAQVMLNPFEGNDPLNALCEAEGLAMLCRSPLAMGLLSGKYDGGAALPKDDVRASNFPWIAWFKDGRATPAFTQRLAAAREVLRSGGRTLVQGALAWIWAKSPAAIPIPGFKSVAQAVENARAMEKGPLGAAEAAEVSRLIGYVSREQ
jgi:aryl-alcohol dehydrogenase-like predicted oxidoreductase